MNQNGDHEGEETKPGKIWGKDLLGKGHETLEDPGKSLDKERHQHSPEKFQKRTGQYERKPALAQAKGNTTKA